jgi:hypothetical protein
VTCHGDSGNNAGIGGGSAMETVEEAATAAAEEVDDGWGRWRLCGVFFSPISYLTITATTTELWHLSLLPSLSLLSPSPLPLLLLFPPPSSLPSLSFLLLLLLVDCCLYRFRHCRHCHHRCLHCRYCCRCYC